MNVWAEELRVFLRANEQKIAAGEFALPLTFRHVIGRQAAVVPAGAPVAASVAAPSVPRD